MCVGGGGGGHILSYKSGKVGCILLKKRAGERGIFSAGKANRKEGCFLLEEIAGERHIFC